MPIPDLLPINIKYQYQYRYAKAQQKKINRFKVPEYETKPSYLHLFCAIVFTNTFSTR